jgi:thiamine pyrophosphate-dependent acetolactate synthase large subunit-like protein
MASVGTPTVAGRILALLGEHGVTTAFGLPGAHNLALWQALDDPAGHPFPQVITVRHEQTAVYAADGLARATGGVGVALVTSGPGAANTVAAFGEAAAARSPVVLVASDVPVAGRDPHRVRGMLHESADQGALFAPLAKAVLEPHDAQAAVAAVELALQLAATAPRGPVYVGIPADVLGQRAPADTMVPERVGGPAVPDPHQVTAAVELLNAAQRPLLWVGGGVVAADACDALDALAWRLGSPVITTYAGRGALPSGHPLLVDAPPHEPVVAALMAEADLLLVLGSALDAMNTRGWSLPRPPHVVDVNVTPGGELDPDVTVTGDIADVLDLLTLRLAGRTPWADAPFALRDAVRRDIRDDGRTARAGVLLDAVDETWPGDGVVVCDMCVAGYWIGGYAAMNRARRLAYPVGWGTLGFGLPAALGAACTARPTLAVVGDGGLAMGVGELATLVQERLPVTVLLVDDGGYGMLRHSDDSAARAGDSDSAGSRGLELLGPDWLVLAGAFGVPAVEVGPTGLARALSEAAADSVARPGPRLVLWREALFPPRTTSPRWVRG